MHLCLWKVWQESSKLSCKASRHTKAVATGLRNNAQGITITNQNSIMCQTPLHQMLVTMPVCAGPAPHTMCIMFQPYVPTSAGRNMCILQRQAHHIQVQTPKCQVQHTKCQCHVYTRTKLNTCPTQDQGLTYNTHVLANPKGRNVHSQQNEFASAGLPDRCHRGLVLAQVPLAAKAKALQPHQQAVLLCPWLSS